MDRSLRQLEGEEDAESAIGVPRGARVVRLPPLHLFRVFDAAARHSSFRLAAETLCVTPSAVSQQIRQLEEFLDVRLFRRLSRRVELTRDGTVLAGAVQEALVILGRACDRLSDCAGPAVICVSAAPAVATRWLVSRLRRFMDREGAAKVTLISSSDHVDFQRQDIDVAIRWGNGSWPGMHAEPLCRDALFPVCAPRLLKEGNIAAPSDLARQTLLQEVNGCPWANWFEAAGCQQLVFQETLYFGDAGLMLEAAAQGQGVCLACGLLAADDLESGRLVRPFLPSVAAVESYYVLTSQELENKRSIAEFRVWIQCEATLTLTKILAAGAYASANDIITPLAAELRSAILNDGLTRKGADGLYVRGG